MTIIIHATRDGVELLSCQLVLSFQLIAKCCYYVHTKQQHEDKDNAINKDAFADVRCTISKNK